MFTSYMLDAAADISHLLIARFIIIVIILPFVHLGIHIYKSIKQQQIKDNLGFDVHYNTSKNPYENDINLLRSAKDKLKEGFGLESLSEEELEILNKYNIL